MNTINEQKPLCLWFVTGSQHLYGPETLAQVAENSRQIAAELSADSTIPAEIICKPTVKSAEEVFAMCREANADEQCIGLIFWMHTFSPAKMWIQGLTALNKPFVHLHTQFHRDIPWADIDMDYMNLHQSAHGDREFGHVCTRLGLRRTVVVGHWQDSFLRGELAVWTRAAKGWHASRHLKVARFGDNMREVAVTEGDKVAAQMRFGWSVNGYGVGDLKTYVDDVSNADLDALVAEYADLYAIAAGASAPHIREQARLEIGMRAFLRDGGFGAFTTTFEDLHGLRQLPGLAVQRLMAEGYGFGGEGDWKTAAMLRVMKVMAEGLPGGTSFMEDYTYHFDPARPLVLGAHMLEICPSIARGKIRLETHPLGIGGKEDPARLVFDAAPGAAINVSPIDLGDRFRIVLNEVEAVEPLHDLPKLPVARALWQPKPDLKTAATAWILAGGSHHTVYSQQLDTRYLEIFAEMAGTELLVIDADTQLRAFKQDFI